MWFKWDGVICVSDFIMSMGIYWGEEFLWVKDCEEDGCKKNYFVVEDKECCFGLYEIVGLVWFYFYDIDEVVRMCNVNYLVLIMVDLLVDVLDNDGYVCNWKWYNEYKYFIVFELRE